MVTSALDSIRVMVAAGRRGVMVTPLNGAEATVLDAAGEVVAGPEPTADLMAAVGRIANGGTPEVVTDEAAGSAFVEPVLPAPRMVVFGAIAVADALIPMAAAAGYLVEIVDPRPWLVAPGRHPDAAAVHCGDPADLVERIEVDASTAVVSFLHEPRLEDPVLYAALSGSASYVGAMGSRRTTAAKRERLATMGLTVDQVAALHAPIGLDIGAVTPREIAVAVLAEIVAATRGAA